MNHTTRFSRITAIIDIQRLERETRKLLWLGFAIAVVFHLAVGSFITFRRTSVKVVKPIPVDFIVVQPKRTKLFSVSPKRFRQKTIRRSAESLRTPSKGIETKALETPEVSDREIEVDIGYDTGKLSTSDILPDSLIDEDFAVRPPEDAIPLKNRLLFDDGRYKAEIMVSPTNKKAIQGYAHLPLGWGEQLTPPDTLRRSIDNLALVINRHTNIYVTRDKRVRLDSPELFTYPFIYITTDKSFELTDSEAGSLGSYLKSGGFAIIDNGVPEFETVHIEKSLRKMIMDAAGTNNDFWIRPLRKGHPVYHCFFDFDNGPPPGYASENPELLHNIYGVFYYRRLVALYSPQGYGRAWGDLSNEEQLRMGVNLVVYALSQGRWFDDDNRLSFFDDKTKTYVEWYENGNIKFWFSERLGMRSPQWFPTGKKVNRVINGLFLYDSDIEMLANKRKWYTDFRDVTIGKKIIKWGEYNLYEGWYENGQKMFNYNYRERSFTEWDENGWVTAQGNSQGSEKITPVAKK